jgi:hypothetical protein
MRWIAIGGVLGLVVGSTSHGTPPTPPWELELRADVVAFGTVGNLGLTLDDVLKGEAELGTVFPEGAARRIGYRPPRRTDRLTPGTEVLVYLERNEVGGFRVLRIGEPPPSIDSIRRFLRLHARIHSADPPWAEILDAQRLGVDESTLYAFGEPPPASAAAPLLAKFEATVARLEAGEELVGNSPLELSHLVGLLNLLASVDPLLAQALLPAWARLIDWHCEQERALGVYTHLLLPGAEALAAMAVEDAPHWAERLERLLDWTGRMGGSAYAGTARALSSLPGDAGVPALLTALDDHREESVHPLIRWSRRSHNEELRQQLRVKTAGLLGDPSLRGPEHLVFRVHLEQLSDALARRAT